MTLDEFYARLKTSETLPTTSGSVQGEFYSAFEELRGKVDGIVAITLAANTPSAGYRSAVMAQELVQERARKTVNKTPDLLPVLKEAGVVDAGAKGLYYFFKGMESAICRPKPSSHIRSTRRTHTPAPPARKEERRVYGFDVQFLLEGEALPLEEIRNRVIASGECPLLVGDEKLLKVHVHTMNPNEILDYARSKGTLSDIVIEDMDQQVQKQAREGKRPRQQ